MPNRSAYHRKGYYTIKVTFSSVELGLMKYYDGSIVGYVTVGAGLAKKSCRVQVEVVGLMRK